MENRDELQIKEFFSKNKVEISDDGFSNRVLRQLPEKQYKTNWIVPLFALAGMIIAGFLIDVQKVILTIYYIVIEVPLYFLFAGIMVLPVVVIIGYFFWEKNQLPKYRFF
ncbi:MAG: DUF5056 domain-containing protein [Porphyromonadaceae bacterium]|jgi:hypothetical protein|nr:DUF5056 domain-containing protein [Porphyromonadaceae bacterium]